MRCIYLLFICLLITFGSLAQRYTYISASKVADLKAYQQQIKADSRKQLVELKKFIPGLALDIRYATTNNFTHQVLYTQPRAFARLPVAEALKAVELELKASGLGLKIYDAYRPYAITVKFYEIARDTNFVADPRKGSRHNRGCAVDLTLIDLKTGNELEMPTGYDSFSKAAAADYSNLTSVQLHNRAILRHVMEQHGFIIYRTEWWHYDFDGWQNFELLDIPFSSL
jgi:D-alanyl-D-alanine dipeptidase